ncbi:MAG TPA: efflux RND transporter permease subunit, partial [Candidatus Methylomirabilis sp.]|nr:efflux RND transporter permease subunit [Candidatus Methylomirabilis sp.]
LGLAILGARAATRIPIDAFPDVSPVQVVVLTESPGLSPEEIEKLITFPVESAMAGLPKVELIRSMTMFGLSTVVLYFEDGTDIFFARRLVLERLGEARERIPRGLGGPEMGPNTTGLGEVFQYYLKSQDRQLSTMDLRSIQDWSIRLLMRTAPGVDDVLSYGGEERQFQILVKPDRLVKYGLALSEVITQVAGSNRSVGGQFLVRNQEEYLVRGRGWAQSVEDLKRTVLKAEKGTPVYLRDVAEVVEGPAPRRGAVTRNGEEVVTGLVLKRTGENTREVIGNIKSRGGVVRQALPAGVQVEPFYDQTELVEKAVSTVGLALLEGGMLVMLVVFLFLGEVRSAIVVVSAVPLSMLIAFLLMEITGLSANLMSLGGLTIAIGMIVDGAVVMVENSFRFLSCRQCEGPEREAAILESSREVANPVAFALLINIISLLPIFALSGLEGKLFRPLVLTKSFGMVAALILSLTAIPAFSSFLLRSRNEQESFLFRKIRAAYQLAL